MLHKRLAIILLIVSSLLLIPLIVMLFTNEVNWDLFDFITAGGLLLGTGLLCDLIIRKTRKRWHRIALCVILLISLLLAWAELAVGIFGTPFGGQ